MSLIEKSKTTTQDLLGIITKEDIPFSLEQKDGQRGYFRNTIISVPQDSYKSLIKLLPLERLKKKAEDGYFFYALHSPQSLGLTEGIFVERTCLLFDRDFYTPSNPNPGVIDFEI